jgi:RimJ/RimL family protein N-acetyltransferase
MTASSTRVECRDPGIVLETERLILRRFCLEDAPFILDLVNQPSFLQYIGDKGVRTIEDARAYLLGGPLASYERFGFGLLRTLRKVDG